MQPPAGSHPAYAGFTPALQFPGQQQHQAQQPVDPQHWQGATQQVQQQQDSMASYQASQARVMRPSVARPPPPASLLQQPQHYYQPQQHYAQPQQYAQPQYAQQMAYGGVMQAQQLGTQQWPSPPTLAAPPPAPTNPSAGLQQHSTGAIMRPQRHTQPPPRPAPPLAASPVFSMPQMGTAVRYNPNTGAPIPQLPSLAAPPPPMAIMRNPNTGAPIYPPGHSMMVMRSTQAAQQQQASAAPGMPAQGQGQPAAPATAPLAPAGTAGRESPSKPQAAFHQQYGGRSGVSNGSGGGYGGAGAGGGGGGRGRTLLAPPAKRLRKKDIALPPERLVEDPVARAPQSAAEAAEVEQWVKERKRFFPTVDGVARKQAEAEARRDRGELEEARTQRQQRLAAVLAQQSAMGLSRAAGTLDMYIDLQRRGGGRGRGRNGYDSGGRSGRGGGRGGFAAGGAFQQQPQQRQQRGFGWESFLAAGEPPAPQQQQQQQQQQQRPQPTPADQGSKRSHAEADAGAAGGGVAPAAAQQADAASGLPCASPDGEPAAKRPRAAGSEDGPDTDGLPANNRDGRVEGGEAPPPLDASQQQLYQQHLQQQAGGEAAALGGGGRDGGRGGGRGSDGRGRGGRGGRFAGGGEFAGGRGGRFAGDGGRGRGGGRGGRGVSWEDQQASGRGGRGGGRCGGRDGGRGGGRGGPHQQQQQFQQRPPRPLPPSLLQKLLAKDIRQDHSALLQAFRFMVRNNFLLEAAAGTPLEFPPPPAYPPAPAKALWGRRHDEEGLAAAEAAQAGDVKALLAAVAQDAIDVDLSGEENEEEEEGEEEDSLMLLRPQAGSIPAAPADLHTQQGEEEEEEEEEDGSSGQAGSSSSSDSEEEGQLAAAHGSGSALLAGALAGGVEIAHDVDFS